MADDVRISRTTEVGELIVRGLPANDDVLVISTGNVRVVAPVKLIQGPLKALIAVELARIGVKEEDVIKAVQSVQKSQKEAQNSNEIGRKEK